MRTLHIAILVSGVLGYACNDQKPVSAKNDEPAAPAAPVETATPKPVEPVKPAGLVFDGSRIGPLSKASKVDVTELQRLFPGAVVERKTEQSEGETSESFVVK